MLTMRDFFKCKTPSQQILCLDNSILPESPHSGIRSSESADFTARFSMPLLSIIMITNNYNCVYVLIIIFDFYFCVYFVIFIFCYTIYNLTFIHL